LQSASAGSIAAIEKAGGKFVKIDQVKRPSQESKVVKKSTVTAKK
jgi:hypothetical protein